MVDVKRDHIPRVEITPAMLQFARDIENDLRVNRTRTSPVDTLAGVIGELAFAQWFYGDWKSNELLKNKGKPDFEDRLEVKTSVFPLSNMLNLPIRADYAKKRQPEFYVWCCIDVPTRNDKQVVAGLEVAIVGWTTGVLAHAAPLKSMGWVRSYQCHVTPVPELRAMSLLGASFKRTGG